MSVCFPAFTPSSIIDIANAAMIEAFKDKSAGLDYSDEKLEEPHFVQTGRDWNRWKYTLVQREIQGALDPYNVQSVLLDALVNKGPCKLIGTMATPGRERHSECVSFLLEYEPEVDKK